MAKKLSPAQQTLVAAIQGKTLTYRIVALWRGGVTVKTMVDIKIDGKRTEIKVRLSTIEALADKGEVILTDHGNKEYTVVLPALEATEVEAHEVEAAEATEAQEVEATEAPEATETITAVWPLKDMSKYGYTVVRVSENPNPAAGYVYYKVIDYKSASLVGLYDPATVCRCGTISAAITAAEEFEKIDIGMSREWRACKIWMARKGLRKSKGVQTKTPATPAHEATEATEATKAARAESLAKTEAATRHLIDTTADDKLHRHTLGTILLAQGKKEAAKQEFLALYESYRRDSRLQEAKQPLWEIILISGTHYSTCQIYIKLAQLCEELGQVEDAMTAYGLAAEADGSVAESYYARARILKSMGELEEAKAYREHAHELADHREVPALSRGTADAIEQRHNVIVDCASEMYTDNHPCSTNNYGITGWKLIPQEWIDEVTTQS